MSGINVSKQHRDDLAQGIQSIIGYINQEEQSAEQQRILNEAYSLLKELKGKRFGLRFEEHREQVDDLLDESVPVLVADDGLQLRNGGEQHFLIEGDNLIALDLLMRTHRGKIDLIYIDPPYNLGKKDFRYDDDYVDKNDTFKHSKWLSFMDRRLRKAKRLLSAKGAIFISINDVEQAQLKILCDEVFGSDCFKGCICWQKTYSPKNDSHGIPAACEYIYVYSKLPDWMPKKLGRTKAMDARYNSPDNDPRPWKSADASAQGASNHQGMVYAIQHPITGRLEYPPVDRHWNYGQDKMLDIMSCWAEYELVQLDDKERRAEICGCSPEEVEPVVYAMMLKHPTSTTFANSRAKYAQGTWPILYFTSGGEGGISLKKYLDEMDGSLPTNFWSYKDVGHTDEAKKELKRVFGGKIPFDTPKPTRLIERILDIATDDDSIVLDFFAGSASTAHAVLMHNNEYGGHRRFILCTNNENGICREVAYERIRRVLEGYDHTDKITRIIFDEKVTVRHVKNPDLFAKLAQKAEEARANAEEKHDKATIKMEDGCIRVVVEDAKNSHTPPLPGSLKYLRVGYVPFDEYGDTYEVADEVLLHMRELVELENGIDFSNDPSVAIALTDDELDEVVATLSDQCKAVYIGHDVLVSAEALDLFQERLISVNEVPEYYYRELED